MQIPLVLPGDNGTYFPTIQAVEKALENINIYAPNMCWNKDEPPANEILGARLRAKYYGAQVITYRKFLLKILEYSATKTSVLNQLQASSNLKHGNEILGALVHEIPNPVLEYAKMCIQALINSTTAFHGLPQDKRLIVTNVWGTAHAYVLQLCFFYSFQGFYKTVIEC